MCHVYGKTYEVLPLIDALTWISCNRVSKTHLKVLAIRNKSRNNEIFGLNNQKKQCKCKKKKPTYTNQSVKERVSTTFSISIGV